MNTYFSAIKKQGDKRIHQLESAFHQLALRERGIIFITVLVTLIMAFDFILFAPLQKEASINRENIQAIHLQNDAFIRQIEILNQKIQSNPNTALQKKRDAMQKQVLHLQKNITKTTHLLIDPSQMPALLAHLFKHQPGLSIHSIKSSPAEEVILGDADHRIPTGLYKHGLNLELSGSFLQIHRYLQSIEADARQLYWNRLDYQVKQYPQAQLTLKTHTLSTSKELIGVY